MAKPRIFVSSTYYDLKYIRAGIEVFIGNLGYEAILFEKGDIPFHHDATLEESCLKEVDNADILILVIGGRYGALSKEDEERIKAAPDEYFGRIRSVTSREYERARNRDIATFIFVEHSVFAEHRTYKENKGNKTIKYAHVDDVRIYEMLDDILGQSRNNFVKEFATLEDITEWLRDQWAGIFVDMMRKRNTSAQIRSLENQIQDLSDVVLSLKKYNEEIIRAVSKRQSSQIIDRETTRVSIARALRFIKEPLIEHIRHFTKGRPNSRAMLKTFLESESLEAFLEHVGFPDSEKTLLSKHDFARRDFRELKTRYGDDMLEADADAEDEEPQTHNPS